MIHVNSICSTVCTSLKLISLLQIKTLKRVNYDFLYVLVNFMFLWIFLTDVGRSFLCSTIKCITTCQLKKF